MKDQHNVLHLINIISVLFAEDKLTIQAILPLEFATLLFPELAI